MNRHLLASNPCYATDIAMPVHGLATDQICNKANFTLHSRLLAKNGPPDGDNGICIQWDFEDLARTVIPRHRISSTGHYGRTVQSR